MWCYKKWYHELVIENFVDLHLPGQGRFSQPLVILLGPSHSLPPWLACLSMVR